jgi:hypothetical protein
MLIIMCKRTQYQRRFVVSAKKMCFSVLFVVAFIGFILSGLSQALTFENWVGTWFAVKSSETGKAGPSVPPGGEVFTNNEKTVTSYLVIESFDITTPVFVESLDITVPAFIVGYCVPEDSTYVRRSTLLPLLGGEPTDFLTLFSSQIQETQYITQTIWVPLEVKGKESRNAAGEITSASFKNIGGIFLEEVAIPSHGGIGSVKFSGSFIKPDEVTGKVPVACLP